MIISKHFKFSHVVHLTCHAVRRISIFTFLIALCVVSVQPAGAQTRPLITVGNASQLAQVNMFGRGKLLALNWLPNAKTLVAQTPIGLWLYDSKQPSAAPRLIPDFDSDVQISKDGRWVVGYRRHLEYSRVVVDVATGALLATFPSLPNHNWCVFGADSSTLAIISQESDTGPTTVTLYALPAATPLTTFTVKNIHNIHAFTFAPDGTFVASGPGGLQLFDGKTGKLQTTIAGYWPSNVQVSPDNNTFIGSNDTNVLIWNRRGLVSSIGISYATEYFGISPDFSLVAVPSVQFRNDILLRNVKTGAYHFLMGHTDAVTQVFFSPNGQSLLSVSKDQTLRIWDVATAKLRLVIPTTSNNLLKVYYSPDGQSIAAMDAYGGEIKIWNTTTGALQTTWAGHYTQVLNMALNPDGKTIAVEIGGNDLTIFSGIFLWDAATGTPQGTLQASTRSRGGIAYSPDGNLIAVGGGSDSKVGLWDAHSGVPRDVIKTGDYTTVAFSTDNKTLFTTTQSAFELQKPQTRMIQLWDIDSSTLRKELIGGLDQIQALAVSPDGTTLAAGYGDINCHIETPGSVDEATVRLWNIADGTMRAELQGHQQTVFDVAYSVDGKMLASAGCDGSILLWDTTSFMSVRAMHIPNNPYNITRNNSVTFSPDGTLLVSGGTDGIRLWEVATGKLLVWRTDPANTVIDVAFSPDGRAIYVGSTDGTVRTYGLINEIF